MGYWKRLAGEYLETHGVLNPPKDILEKIKPMTMTESAALFIREFGLQGTPEQVADDMNAMMDEHYRSDIPLKPGVKEYLARLRDRGVRMCVASATAEPLMEACLSRLGVREDFEFLLSCETVGAGKHQPDVYLESIRRLGATESETAVYEDALYFTGDNGILVSHSLTEPVVYDTSTLTTTANIRAGLTYHKGTDALYTVAKDGTLFQIQCGNQKITKVSSGKIMSGANFITCTSTPTIYNNRLYVGCMADQYGYVCIMDILTLKPIYQVKGFQNAEVKSSPLVSTRSSSTGEVTVYFSMNALPGGLYAFKDTEGKTSASLHTLYIPQAKQYCLSSITADDKGRLYYSNDSGTLFCVTLAKDIPATSTPTVTSIPAATSTPTVSNSLAPAAKKSVSKPKKPYSVKVKKSKKKYKVTWKKKSKKYQTIISYRYGKGKWKKKTIKKNTAVTIKMSKKRLQIRLRCKIKNQSKWIYSAYTKTFSFHP